MSYRIGIDVGGTNTDAVVLDDALRVVASIKSPTEADSGDGVARAIDRVLEASGIPASEVRAAMLGTTHCTNAIVERRGLGRVGVLRIGGPATTAVPPFEGWPRELRDAVAGPAFVIAGGNEFDGREISALDESAVRAACAEMRGAVDAVAVVGVFSPVADAHELRAAEIATEELGLPVSRSAEIGSIGLLERENATILNASLVRTLGRMADGFRESLDAHGIDADIYFGQNDGTLMRLDYALQFPVLTIGCGPTNSIRGAAHLSGVSDALVVDIGGTTTDIGVLVGGFPRQSAHAAEIGGIRTNFRMPDVLSVGLGGGTLTTTDVAVAGGRLDITGGSPVALDPRLREASEAAIRALLEESIDRMKPSAAAVPIVLVGGGSVIAPDGLEGVSDVIRPDHAGAANAVGAALGDVAGQAERVFSLRETSRQEAVDAVRTEAVERAVAAGAHADTVEVLALEELPVAYMEDTVIVRARAAGRLV